jgi:hypothetical protein
VTVPELADCFVPVPMRWRLVAAGDVFVAKDGRLWSVGALGPRVRGSGLYVAAHCGLQSYETHVDPDDVIHVLIPTPERDAVLLTRDQLGARVFARRTAPPED